MPQKICKKTKRKIVLVAFLVLFISHLVFVSAAEDFDNILKPLTTIYNLVKYTATAVAGLVMLFAGITYITSGSDPKKRDTAKNMVMYVIIGLMVIWAAPFVVELILGG